jgi:hypothetical protein
MLFLVQLFDLVMVTAPARIDLTGWVAGPKRQSIDVNIDHWQSYAFTDDAGTDSVCEVFQRRHRQKS